MSTSEKMVWVVEDEPKLAQLLVDYLHASGYQARIFSAGTDVVEQVRRQAPALLLLDLMLPGKDGLTICREIRAFSELPIIMITARVEEIDRLLGLELGADDYICKPFSPREVVARVKAIFRRVGPHDESLPVTLFTVDEDCMSIHVQGRLLDLTANEYRLLALFISRPGRVFSRNLLLESIYPDNHDVSDRSIDSYIKNLRRKLAKLVPEENIIQSIYGVGYKLEIPETGNDDC